MSRSDLAIARSAKLAKLGIGGEYKAKLSFDYVNRLQERPDGKLIPVTAISPTPAAAGIDLNGKGNVVGLF